MPPLVEIIQTITYQAPSILRGGGPMPDALNCWFPRHASAGSLVLPLPHALSTDYGLFKVVNVYGDGRCFFRAIALVLDGSECHYQRVIDQVVETIEGDWPQYEDHVTLNHPQGKCIKTAADYRKFMQYGSAYASTAEVCAAAVALKLNILVFNQDGQLLLDAQQPGIGSQEQYSGSISVMFMGQDHNGHYLALLPDSSAMSDSQTHVSINASQEHGSNMNSLISSDVPQSTLAIEQDSMTLGSQTQSSLHNARKKRNRCVMPGVQAHKDGCNASISVKGASFNIGKYDTDIEAMHMHDVVAMLACSKPQVVCQQFPAWRDMLLPSDILPKLYTLLKGPTIVSNGLAHTVWASEHRVLSTMLRDVTRNLGFPRAQLLPGLATLLHQSLAGLQAIVPEACVAIAQITRPSDLYIESHIEQLCYTARTFSTHIMFYDDRGLCIFSSNAQLNDGYVKEACFLFLQDAVYPLSGLPTEDYNVDDIVPLSVAVNCLASAPPRAVCIGANPGPFGDHVPMPSTSGGADVVQPAPVPPLCVNEQLLEFETLCGSGSAAHWRDLAIILTKSQQRLKVPLQTHWSRTSALRVPRALYERLATCMLGPCWIKHKPTICWTSEQLVFVSAHVSKDAWTCLRSMATMLLQQEDSFCHLQREVIAELNDNWGLYNRLLQNSVAHKAEPYACSWSQNTVLHTNAMNYNVICQPDRHNLLELAVVARIFQVNVTIFSDEGDMLVETNLEFNMQHADTIKLIALRDQHGLHYQPLRPVVQMDASEAETHWHSITTNASAGSHADVHTNCSDSLHQSSTDIQKSLDLALDKADMSAIKMYDKAKTGKLVHVCFSCERLFFRSQVQSALPSRRKLVSQQQELPELLSIDGEEWVCRACQVNISRNTTSEYASSKGYKNNPIPAALQNMTNLEERLVAANTPFMQIRKLPMNMQLRLSGAVINVSNDLSLVLQDMPTTENLDATIQI